MPDGLRPARPSVRTRSARTRGVRLLAASILVTALGLAPSGCRDEPVEEAPPTPAAEAEPELTPDEKLAEHVRQAMLQAPALARENIRIAVAQGKVFLMGEVTAPHLRDEAVAVAGSVPGVTAVDSKINVRR